MILQDLHVHTHFSDGKHSPEEIAKTAYEMGVQKLGFSDHGYTSMDNRYCMKIERLPAYIETISNLKEKYKGRMEILMGIEQDLLGGKPEVKFDYVIGSVHYQSCNGDRWDIDGDIESVKTAVSKHYNGDIYTYCEKYFEDVSKVVDVVGADIVGHFDLLTKFNEKEPLIDETNPRYRKAWKKAVDYLLTKKISFEINTGAISRGYRTTPYPSFEMIQYIFENGGKMILNSDSHSKETLCFRFDLAMQIVKDAGFSL